MTELKHLLDSPKNIVIVSHIKPDGDAIGSSLGLYNYLIQLQHDVTVIMPSEFPSNIGWLPGADKILVFSNVTIENVKQKIETADIIFCLDFSRLSRIEKVGEFIKNSKAYKVMIDHHLEPEHFANFEISDISAASTCSLILNFIKSNYLTLLNSDIATCLYLGLMTDTGNFRHNNLTVKEFENAAELMKHNINPNIIYRKVYESSSYNRLKLLGYAINKMQLIDEYNTVYITLSLDELNQFHAETGDTEGFVNHGLEAANVKVSVLMYEKVDGDIKMSFRSNDDIDVNIIAKHFNGGGHKNASGGNSNLTLDETVQKLKEVLPLYKEMLK